MSFDLATLQATAARIRPLTRTTPLRENLALNEQAGARLFLKAEGEQTGGSFKIRGAMNSIACLRPAQRAAGVVAFSSGNHAIAVAHAAQHFRVPATIVMPSDAPHAKRAQTAALGAHIVEYERTREDRETIAQTLVTELGGTLIKPFDAWPTILGQATVGAELYAQTQALATQLDGVAICCSGGGLTAGVALALEQLSPQTEIWAVEPVDFDDTAQSLAMGHRVALDLNGRASICDALLLPTPGELTFSLNRRRLSGVATVTDAEVCAAMRAAYANENLVLEPGGAVALAAALTGKLPLNGGNWAVILTGSNVDPADFAKWTGIRLCA